MRRVRPILTALATVGSQKSPPPPLCDCRAPCSAGSFAGGMMKLTTKFAKVNQTSSPSNLTFYNNTFYSQLRILLRVITSVVVVVSVLYCYGI